MSSFFTTPASQKKRKREATGLTPAAKKRNITSAQPRSRPRHDSSISGSDSADEDDASPVIRVGSDTSGSEESDAADQTEAERRLKLAEQYLENVRADVDTEREAVDFNAEDVDRDLIAARLKEDVAEEKGRLYRRIAGELDFEQATKKQCCPDTCSISGVACCPPFMYTVSKGDMTLIKWDMNIRPQHDANYLDNRKKPRRNPPKKRHFQTKPKELVYTRGNKRRDNDPSFHHHTKSILCVTASADGRFVVTGGADRKLIVWDSETLKPLKIFTQHRDAVTSLAFRGKTNQLFSASKDRTVKIWSLNELAYVETLFGHQDEVLDVAAVGGPQERCVSVGARDRTARLWKVVEESQLVFRGGGMGAGAKRAKKTTDIADASDLNDDTKPLLKDYLEGSVDRVIQIDSHLFVTGSDSGALSLYGLHKKKPLDIFPLAHGMDPEIAVDESTAEVDTRSSKTSGQPTARWITALACVPFTDLFLSGSWDGYVRAWRIGEDQKSIESAGVLGQVEAIVNGTFQADGLKGIGAEDPARIRGFVNDLAMFERGDRGRESLCVVAGIGSGPRLGQWMATRTKNGAVVFEVPRRPVINGAAIRPNGDGDAAAGE